MAVVAAGMVSGRARADSGFIDIWSNGQDPPAMVFPNWKMIYAGSFGAWICPTADACGGAAEIIRGLTVANFGTAGPADLTAVVVKMSCGATSSGLLTLVYAGTYLEDAGPMNAWTWAGISPNFAGCADLCGAPACGALFTIDVYVDVAPCPTNLATISMGFPTHFAVAGYGSISDDWYAGPFYDIAGGSAMIAYTYKTSTNTTVAPGDTITYTVYYGKPGTNALSSVVINDPQPPYTHYVQGSGVPAPDVGWDPDPGPPISLRWTVNPVTGNPPAWGPTGEIRYSLTVDWGNMDSFEPGSGNVAAPEGQRLNNTANVTFNGTSCPSTTFSNPPVSTVVKRYIFWSIGDNDILFSPTYGQPADEMTYSIFIKNVSTTKTWWNVRLWDTVPGDLDVWGPNYGFDDPCLGWTMTPSGCAAATPGRTTSAGKTLLTWKLDMPPGLTMELRWKGRVSATAQATGTVINTLSVLSYGNPGVANGTGHSGLPRNFLHLAPIVLPTMYTSYVGYAAGDTCCVGYLIAFFPLNKKAQFELRALFYSGVGWASTGGVSASIGSLVGDCIGGFPTGGIPGCRVERIPAKYDLGLPGSSCVLFCPTLPYNDIFKVTSNSPTLWQLLTHENCHCQDNHTYAPSTNLSYTGLMHYIWRRDSPAGDPGSPGNGDCLEIINTSMDAYGVFQPTFDTTVYEFKFNYTTLGWDLYKSWDLCPESAAYDWMEAQPLEGAYRTVSSQGQLIVNQGMLTNPQLAIGGHADNEMAYMPTRETGNTVSTLGAANNFYGVVQGASQAGKVVIGNVGAVDAVYRVWRYVPDSLIVPARFPAWLGDTCGTWQLKGTHTVPAGLNTASNPRVYPTDAGWFDQSNTLVLAKVEVLSGGPIQVAHGIRVGSFWSSGSVIQAADGQQAGIEYWINTIGSGDASKGNCDNREMFCVDVFCPRQDMAVRMRSEDGYSATYTTTGPDQCISFMALSSDAATRNFRIDVLPNVAQGAVIAQVISCAGSEKGYTAPFLQQGVHYEIIAPPSVFSGQSFWITIVVKNVGGGTKTNYVGTTSFTSTDPAAKILGSAMEITNYTWVLGDAGVKIFVNVTLTKLGTQTIVASDTTDGSINGLTAILVVATDVKLEKRPRLSVAASGDTVQFKICWSNYSSTSAFTFVITDAVPMGTTYVPEAATAMDCGNTGGQPLTVGYTTLTSPTVPAAGSFITGPSPATGSRWLRWTIPYVGVNTTGCACFKVTVN